MGARYATTLTIDEERVRDFATVSGDSNPIHMDGDAARRAGFRGRVAHGAILLSELSRVIGMELPGPGSLWISSEIDFRAPVYVGDEIDLEAVVEHVSPAFGLVVLRIEGRRAQDGAEVLRGLANIKTVDEQMALSFTPLDQQKVLVTGGTRGVGRLITSHLLARGARVVAVYRSSEPAIDDLLPAGDSTASDRLTIVKCDVSNSAEVETLFAGLGDEPIHSVVHAASPRVEDIPLEDLEWEAMSPFFETFIKGGLDLVRRSIPHFRETGTGRVVFIGSEAVHQPKAQWTHYVTAKSAFLGLARALAVELADMGATVNVVSPGAVHTSDLFPASAKTLIKNATPLKRLVSEEEIAEVVTFLLEAGGSFITGSNIPMTGGRIFLP